MPAHARSQAWTLTCLGKLGKQISEQAIQGGKFSKQRAHPKVLGSQSVYIPEVLFVTLEKCTQVSWGVQAVEVTDKPKT